MTVAQALTLLGGTLVISLVYGILLIRMVRSEVDKVCAKIDEISAKVDKLRRWLDARDA